MRKFYTAVLSCALFLSCLQAEDAALSYEKSAKFKFGPLEERTQIEGQDFTQVTITDAVKASGLSAIGLNFGKGGAPNNPATKLRSTWSFEGPTLRSCVKVFQVNGNKVSVFGGKEYLDKAYVGGAITVLSGKYKGETAQIIGHEFGERFFPAWNKTLYGSALILDKEFPNLNAMNPSEELRALYKEGKVKKPYPDGLLLENMNLQHVGKRPSGWWAENVTIENENRPGGTGTLSGRLTASGKGSRAVFRMGGAQEDVDKGEASAVFWARRVDGDAVLKVQFAKGISADVVITDEWQQYTVKKALPGQKGFVVEIFLTGTGAVLIDEVAVYVGGDTNPTPFRDNYIKLLKEMNVGIFRSLQMGGNTMENFLRPRVEQNCYISSAWYMANVDKGFAGGMDGTYGIHEVCELCEYLGIDPWYNLPGTLHEDEIDLFMEYIGGPAGTRGGDMRIALGQIEPWTEVLHQINVEYGNEQWNVFGPFSWGGYAGPGYWSGLTQRAKESPYFKDNVIFHAGSQNKSTLQAKGHCINNANMDRVSAAPYIWHSFSKKEDDLTYTEGNSLFSLCYGKSLDLIAGSMGDVDKVLREGGMEGLSIYEFNYHMTAGSAPLYNRYRTYYTLGGALNIANSILYMQKELRAKELCLFNFSQQYYGNKKNYPGWGITLYDRKKGEYRYRPTALAMDLMNKAILVGGDSMQTLHEGACPTFSSIGKFKAVHVSKGALGQLTGIPLLWTYAFKNGKERSVALINLDTESDQTITLNFPGKAKNVQSWQLSNDSIYAHNEWWDFPTSSFINEFKFAFDSLKQTKAAKEKYTEEFLASKAPNELAMEILKDCWVPLVERRSLGLIKETMPETAQRWIEQNAQGVSSVDDMFAQLQTEFDTMNPDTQPSRIMGNTYRAVVAWIEAHSQENSPQLDVQDVQLEGLTSGMKILLPKHSMQVIKWTEE